jgi:hypothetical protein
MVNKPREAPTAVGTSYAPARDELANIRAQASKPAANLPPQAAPIAPPLMARPQPPPNVTSPPSKPSQAFSAITPPQSTTPRPAESRERPATVGTSYEPVSLGKPGKLGSRLGAFQQQSAPPASATSAYKPASSGGKLTWSERQALAQAQRAEEDAASQDAISQSSAPASKPVQPPPMPVRAPEISAAAPPAGKTTISMPMVSAQDEDDFGEPEANDEEEEEHGVPIRIFFVELPYTRLI